MRKVAGLVYSAYCNDIVTTAEIGRGLQVYADDREISYVLHIDLNSKIITRLYLYTDTSNRKMLISDKVSYNKLLVLDSKRNTVIIQN